MSTVVSLPIITVFFVGIVVGRPDLFAAKVGFAVAAVAAVWGLNCRSGIHYLHRFFLSFLCAATAMAIISYWKSLRRLLSLDRKPHCPIEVTGRALVEMFPWRYLYHFSVAILVLLGLLILALQLGSLELFAAFGACWAVTFLALMVLSSKSP